MKPRNLRYLRVNDEPPNTNDDLTQELPVDVEDLGKWFEFCKDVARQRMWDFELLTLDFNFKSDNSGPWFPLFGQDPKVYNADFLKDANLRHLRWPDSLVTNQIGPNSGLLIGAYLVAHAAHRDLPYGVAFHTRYPGFVIYDMPSAMLATQILLASGANLSTLDLRETMSKAIDIVIESVHQPALGLGTAAARFRQAFLRRAGASGLPDEDDIYLWAEPSSLWGLLDIFRAAETEEDLHERLVKVGLEFYDRDGILESLSLRSMFLDRLIYKTPEGVTDVRERLPLSDVKPAGEGQTEPGEIWQFVETLAARTPSNIAPVLNFFRDSGGDGDTRSINEAVKRKIHRLIALIFAWLDLYAEGWFEDRDRGYDPFKKTHREDFPSLIVQVSALLKIYDLTKEEGWTTEDGESFDPKIHFLHFSDKEGIYAAVREQAGVPGSALYRPLRYDKQESERLGQKRHMAVEFLLDVAARWRCVEKEVDANGEPSGRYRLKYASVPKEDRPYSGSPRQADIAQRLGFHVKPNQDASRQLSRIIQDNPGFEKYGVQEFLVSLEERPLPDHLKWLGWEFMDEFWGSRSDLPLPYDAWPVCLSEVGRESGESISLVEWKRRVQRSQEAARQVQSLIMPSPVSIHDGRFEIWCWRHSAEEVGGDYYRVKKARDGEYRLYIGDACGSGPSAALLTQEIHGLITILEEQVPSPEQLCAQLDVRLFERAFGQSQQEDAGRWGLSNQWASLFCGVLDTNSNRMIYTNAGHPPPILARRDGSTLELGHAADSLSRAIGLLPGNDYHSETVELMRGDRVVLFTDGVGEALEDGLLACVRDNQRLSAKELGQALTRKTMQANGPDDDKSLIVVSVE